MEVHLWLSRGLYRRIFRFISSGQTYTACTHTLSFCRGILPLVLPNQKARNLTCRSFQLQCSKSSVMDLYKNLALDSQIIDELSEDAIDFASTHGMVMRNRKSLELMNYAPFTLFPSPFPKHLFEEAISLQQEFHSLICSLKKDDKFLQESLESVLLHDEFTKRLFEIYEEVQKEGVRQPINLMLVRSDYMIHDTHGMQNGSHISDQHDAVHHRYEMRQIEINLIASSFSGLGTRACQIHRHVADLMGERSPYQKEKLPPNNAVKGLGLGLAKAWQAYCSEKAVVVFIVLTEEKNRYDQRLLEYQFYQGVESLGCKHHVPVLYKSLEDISKEGRLSDDFKLFLGDQEVAVAYFRAGYSPDSYPVEECWQARRMIERSMAIKSPDIAGHLLGSKKVQQVLANPGVLERFVKDQNALHRIRRTFAGLYSLDPGPEGDKTEQMALKDPYKFVLKPQREGGGNNVYGDNIVSVLNGFSDPKERGQYILMERVHTPVYKNYTVHIEFGGARLLDVVNELGIYGVLILDGDKQLTSETVGYLVRTKSTEHDDGGVASGRAVLDSACLINE